MRFLVASVNERILYGQLDLYLKTYVVDKNFQKQPKCAPDHSFPSNIGHRERYNGDMRYMTRHL